jgi:ParB family chromosome partitioning protein
MSNQLCRFYGEGSECHKKPGAPKWCVKADEKSCKHYLENEAKGVTNKTAPDTTVPNSIRYIEITKLHPHPDNPRKDLGDLTELAESIKAKGVLQNLTVVPFKPKYNGGAIKIEGAYTVIIGHRRLAAAKLAGLTELPCVVTEMDHHDQVATMLIENIQRNDLTILEQAQGFQMMMDLGDTAADIALKTGFSEMTVKHRVKMNELDNKKLKAAQERGGRIEDYIKLEQIKDIKLRNKVLEKIGTGDFKWCFENALEEEARPDRKKKLNELLQSFAKPAPKSTNGLDYVNGFYGFKLDGFKKPKDANSVEYFYSFSDTSCTLYKKRSKDDQPKLNPGEAEFNERYAKFEELSKRAYELRTEFVKNFAPTRKYAAEINAFAFATIIRGGGINVDKLMQWLGLPKPVKGTDYSEAYEAKRKAITEKYQKDPERTMLYTAYFTLDDGPHKNYVYAQRWNGFKITHQKNGSLDLIYEALVSLGYELSDEEQQLRDGTHELFNASEADKDDDDESLPVCDTEGCPFNNSDGRCCFEEEDRNSEGYLDDIRTAIEKYSCENGDVKQEYDDMSESDTHER